MSVAQQKSSPEDEASPDKQECGKVFSYAAALRKDVPLSEMPVAVTTTRVAKLRLNDNEEEEAEDKDEVVSGEDENDDDDDGSTVQDEDDDDEELERKAMMGFRSVRAVVDTGAFIAAPVDELRKYSEVLYTVAGVSKELKSRHSRLKMGLNPQQVKIVEPKAESLKFVMDFAKKSGKYTALSHTDMEVLALAHQFHTQTHGWDSVKQEPPKPIDIVSETPRVPLCTDSNNTSECKIYPEDLKIPGFYNGGSAGSIGPEDPSLIGRSRTVSQTSKASNAPAAAKAAVTQKESSTCNLRPVKEIPEQNIATNVETVDEQTEDSNKDDSAEWVSAPVKRSKSKQNRSAYSHQLVDLTKLENSDNIDRFFEQKAEQFTDEDFKESLESFQGQGQMGVNGECQEDSDEDGSEDDEYFDAGEDFPFDDRASSIFPEENEEDGWITGDNWKESKRRMRALHFGADEEKEMNPVCDKLVCVTTDFAMQALLHEMGIIVMSADGLKMANMKSYVLKCYSCHKVTNQLNKVFCPHCGCKSLVRLFYSQNEDGETIFHYKKDYQIRRRTYKKQKVYQRGKFANNPWTHEDQSFPARGVPKRFQEKNNPLAANYTGHEGPFMTRDVTSNYYNKMVLKNGPRRR